MDAIIEGSRDFDIVWGAVTGGICLLLGWNVLYWWLPRPSVLVFGREIDPTRRLQLYWGLFAMGMAGTNFGCRFIEHRYLELVHPTFAVLTLVVVAVLGPPVLAVTWRGYQRRFAGR